MTKAAWEGRAYWLTYPQHCCSSGKGVRTGTRKGQKPGGRNCYRGEAMEGAAYWLASPALLSLLSYRTQGYQHRAGTTHSGSSHP